MFLVTEYLVNYPLLSHLEKKGNQFSYLIDVGESMRITVAETEKNILFKTQMPKFEYKLYRAFSKIYPLFRLNITYCQVTAFNTMHRHV